jgi:serine/threonine-protein kinase
MTIAAFGKYEVIDKIGEGGFGKVFKGRDPHLNRLVAIKTCSSNDSGLRQRFLREGEIAGRLHHPNITTVFAFDIEGDTPYLVQEFLDGQDLDHIIKSRQVLAAKTRLGYLVQVAEGLLYAHSQEVVHRDIKPANIRVLENGQVRIMDFGIAKLMTAEFQLTQTGMTLGTAGYLSPEQLKSEPVDQRADLFSFGVLAYELMTYERPFVGSNLSSILYAIAHQEPLSIAEIWSGCPPQLAVMIETCLKKDPAERYRSFSEVLAVLRPLSQTAGSSSPTASQPALPLGTAVDPLAKTVFASTALESGSLVVPGAGKRASKAPLMWIAMAILVVILVAILVANFVGMGILGPWAISNRLPEPEGKTSETTTEATNIEKATNTEKAEALPPESSTESDAGSATENQASVTENQESSTEAPESNTEGFGSVAKDAESATFPDRTFPSPEKKPSKPEPRPPASPPEEKQASPNLSPHQTAPETEPKKSQATPPSTTSPPILLITDIPTSYAVGQLNQSHQVYGDRDFRFATVPEEYRDLHYIMALNADKKSQSSVSFTVNLAVEVFVAHDQQIRKKPDWLSFFRLTGEELAVNEGGEESRVALYDVYVQDFPAGGITLGPNTRPKARGKQMSMYTIFVRPR